MIEFPKEPIAPEEELAAVREIIEAKRDEAATIDKVNEGDLWDQAVLYCRSRTLRAEARLMEIQQHNGLFQAGRLAEQMERQHRQGGLIIPGIVPPGRVS